MSIPRGQTNRSLLVTGLLPLVSSCQASEWYPGVIHAHTTFSDGALSPALLADVVKGQGAKFMVVADHYDRIGKAEKGLKPLAVVHCTGSPQVRWSSSYLTIHWASTTTTLPYLR